MEFSELFTGGALVIIGFMTKTASDYLNHRRVFQQEEKQRHEERSDVYRLRRFNFQMETLISLQDEVADVCRKAGQINHFYFMEFKKHSTWQMTDIPKEIDEGFLKCQQNLIKLSARIRNAQIRELVTSLRYSTNAVARAASSKESDIHISEMTVLMETLNQEVGSEFRRLDSDEKFY